ELVSARAWLIASPLGERGWVGEPEIDRGYSPQKQRLYVSCLTHVKRGSCRNRATSHPELILRPRGHSATARARSSPARTTRIIGDVPPRRPWSGTNPPAQRAIARGQPQPVLEPPPTGPEQPPTAPEPARNAHNPSASSLKRRTNARKPHVTEKPPRSTS